MAVTMSQLERIISLTSWMIFWRVAFGFSVGDISLGYAVKNEKAY